MLNWFICLCSCVWVWGVYSNMYKYNSRNRCIHSKHLHSSSRFWEIGFQFVLWRCLSAGLCLLCPGPASISAASSWCPLLVNHICLHSSLPGFPAYFPTKLFDQRKKACLLFSPLLGIPVTIRAKLTDLRPVLECGVWLLYLCDCGTNSLIPPGFVQIHFITCASECAYFSPDWTGRG